MTCPRRIYGFTLVELLAVLVIVGLMLALTGGMSKTTRDTFVAQQYIKTSVQNARILRRKSMLISRNSGEDKWVHGIGFRLEKNSFGQWSMIQIKALSNRNIDFYQSFPSNETCLRKVTNTNSQCSVVPGATTILWEQLEGSPNLTLSGGLKLDITTSITIRGSERTSTCTEALTVLYESVKGTLHVYCKNANGLELPIDYLINPESMAVRVGIQYDTTPVDRYGFYLNLTDNGEIDAKQY